MPEASLNSSSEASKARPFPLNPEENSVIWTGCEAAKTLPFSMPVFRSWIDINVILGFALALLTLDMPGCLPTIRIFVLPLTLPVTRPPNDWTMAFTRSLPRFNPEPPPTSGKMPVDTQVRPAMQPSTPLMPGFGITKAPPGLLGAMGPAPGASGSANADDGAASTFGGGGGAYLAAKGSIGFGLRVCFRAQWDLSAWGHE